MVGVGDGDTREGRGLLSELAIKTPGRHHWRCAGVLIVGVGYDGVLFWCFCCWLWANKFWLGIINFNEKIFFN